MVDKSLLPLASAAKPAIMVDMNMTDSYNALGSRRRAFIDACVNAGLKDTATRDELLTIARDIGMTYAPSWIVQCADRRVGRGIYSIAETAGSPASCREDQDAVDPVPVPVVGTTTTVPTMNVMGLTAGEHSNLIPSKIGTYVPFGFFKDLEKVLKSNIFYPCFITGMSGNGKTTMVDQVCSKLNRDLYRVNITCQTDEDDLLGGFRLIDGSTVWQDGPVVRAMESGGVLLLDEIDLGSHSIMCLQPVLEGKGVFLKKVNRWVTPAKGFNIIATANTKGKGSDDGRFMGTNVLNEAFLDRFPITIEQEYPTQAVEKKILKKNFDLYDLDDDGFIDHLVRWANTIRSAFKEDAVDEIISTRRLVNIVTAFAMFGDRLRSINLAISRFDEDTKESFLSLYKKVDGDIERETGEGAPEGEVEYDAANTNTDSKCPF